MMASEAELYETIGRLHMAVADLQKANMALRQLTTARDDVSAEVPKKAKRG